MNKLKFIATSAVLALLCANSPMSAEDVSSAEATLVSKGTIEVQEDIVVIEVTEDIAVIEVILKQVRLYLR